ncbi:MAG: PEPxxWA-CTERM sorting domain-containing protein [Proteobacteria bacterium]|nr:PEPxxWA-CTERM sorting domain-containing protein [Pseudomonadota bacterium]
MLTKRVDNGRFNHEALAPHSLLAMPKLRMLSASLLVFAAGTVNAQSVDLSTGTAVMANGLDSNGNPVKMYIPNGYDPLFDRAWYVYYNAQDGAEHVSKNTIVPNAKGTGYASMQRGTREVELARGIYGNNPKYDEVIDWGITRDANWSATYTATGATPSVWGGSTPLRGIEGFLKNAIKNNQVGFIDSYITKGYGGITTYTTTAELYGSSTVNSNGVGYQAGLKYIDTGKGVIGASAGLYYDEAGQYHMDASGNITFDGNLSGKSSNAASVEYDDWNQHGIVLTGADLIAYTVGFTANGTDTMIEGSFGVLGDFRDVYVNGNKIDQSLLNLTENVYGTTIIRGNSNGDGVGKGIVGQYTMSLDLSDIDPSFWNADGYNNISFLVGTVTPWMLGLGANDAPALGGSNPYAYPYAIVAGFNYFSADIQYYSGPSPVPEPETWAMLLAGLGMIGATVKRRRMLKS